MEIIEAFRACLIMWFDRPAIHDHGASQRRRHRRLLDADFSSSLCDVRGHSRSENWDNQIRPQQYGAAARRNPPSQCDLLRRVCRVAQPHRALVRGPAPSEQRDGGHLRSRPAGRSRPAAWAAWELQALVPRAPANVAQLQHADYPLRGRRHQESQLHRHRRYGLFGSPINRN